MDKYMEDRMKYISIRIPALVFILAFLAFTSFAAPGDATLLSLESDKTDEYIQQTVAVVGDALYILRHDEGLYSYHVGDETPTMIMDLKKYDAMGTERTEVDNISLMLESYQRMSAPAEPITGVEGSANNDQPERELVFIQYIVGGGDKLYALDYAHEQLWALNEEKGAFEPALNLDTSSIKSGAEDRQWVDAFNHRIIDGALYMLVRDYNTYMPALKKFDLTTGAATDINMDMIIEYAPYKDGKLLVSLGEWDANEIGILDLETGSYEKKMDLTDYGYNGLQYNGEIDAHYMIRLGEILRSVAFGEWETAAYIPVSNYGYLPCAMLPGGYLALCRQDSVLVRNTDPRYRPEQPLKINGVQYEDITRWFTKANPDMPIAYNDAYFMSIEEMAAHMAGPGAADVYTFYSGVMDLGDLYKKGYLADMSGNRAIKEIVSRIYPDIRDLLVFDGKIVAIPYGMYAGSFGVCLKTLEEIGLTRDDAPKTYYELLEFVERWIDEYSAEYPDLKLFEYSEGLNQQLTFAILNAQVIYCGAQNEPLTFETPVMRKLLAKLESIDFTPLIENVKFEDEIRQSIIYVTDSNEGSAPLFNLYNSITIDRYTNYMDRDYEPTPLALDEGMPAMLDAYLSALVLNQKSADKDEAMRFMQYYAENMYQAMRVNTMPGENEPIENPYSTQNAINYRERLDILESILEMADEGAKPLIETDIYNIKQAIEDEDKQKWAASPESIARYRSFYDYIEIVKVSPLFSRYNDEITTLINRYLDKQIKSGQFIMELSQKLRMMQMEG
jgi:ABC-type glycerol-3-phosphate transport system substrate-binding protein